MTKEWHGGKGSTRRNANDKAYADNWDLIWNKEKDNGAVAQLGERVPCTDEVAGSTPVSSTIIEEDDENRKNDN